MTFRAANKEIKIKREIINGRSLFEGGQCCPPNGRDVFIFSALWGPSQLLLTAFLKRRGTGHKWKIRKET